MVSATHPSEIRSTGFEADPLLDIVMQDKHSREIKAVGVFPTPDSDYFRCPSHSNRNRGWQAVPTETNSIPTEQGNDE